VPFDPICHAAAHARPRPDWIGPRVGDRCTTSTFLEPVDTARRADAMRAPRARTIPALRDTGIRRRGIQTDLSVVRATTAEDRYFYSRSVGHKALRPLPLPPWV
jgi:hypothetical protein